MDMFVRLLPFTVYVTVFLAMAVALVAIVYHAVTVDERIMTRALQAEPSAPAEQAPTAVDRAA